MKFSLLVLVSVLLAGFAIAESLYGGGFQRQQAVCHQRAAVVYQKQAVVYKAVAPAYVAYQLGAVYYAPSVEAQVNATVEKRLTTDKDYQEFLRYQAFQQGFQAGQQGISDRPQPPTVSVLTQKCADCHGAHKAEPDGGFYLDVTVPLSAEAREAAEERIRDGSMPPPDKREPLTQEEARSALNELYELRQFSRQSGASQPASAPATGPVPPPAPEYP